MSLGPLEIGLIVLVILLFAGAKKLPDLASSLGRSMRIFKSEVREMNNDDKAAAQDPAQQESPQAPQRELPQGGNANQGQYFENPAAQPQQGQQAGQPYQGGQYPQQPQQGFNQPYNQGGAQQPQQPYPNNGQYPQHQQYPQNPQYPHNPQNPQG